ncbi:MAG: hypothetical protein EXR79_05680 [Myxococcales bacterium]|nr:hypothetical protein [Myxococcales bacterium]
MKGFGLTVVKGTAIERFDIEVIGVLNRALPKQDLVLIRCAGLNLEHSGIVAGMSGSPIYVTLPGRGDLLVGALSYGFQFNKDPVAGVTPIGAMLPEMDRKLTPPPVNQRLVPAPAPPPRHAAVRLPDGAEMQPVAVPLAFAGFHADVLAWARPLWSDMGFPFLTTAAGGALGAAKKGQPSVPFAPGGAVSLSLARGDMSISGVGTITWVRDDRFIAFGHPFKGMGQVHLPVGGADVQWILASQSQSFKMANPTEDAGVLDQDRQPAIAGRMGVRATMVPVRVHVASRDRKETQVWQVEVTDQPIFMPMAAAMVISNAVRVSEPIAEDVALTMHLHVELEGGHAPIDIDEAVSGLNGMAQVSEVAGLVQNVTKAIVFNGFERLRVASISASFEVADARNVAFVEWARAPGDEVEVGQAIPIRVGLQVANEAPTEVTLTLPPLPRELAGSDIQVQIGGEKAMPPEVPEPANVNDLLDFLRKQIPRSRLAAVVALPEPTLMGRGWRLSGLPLHVRGELAGHPVQTRAGKETLRAGKTLPWTLNGSASVKLRVRPIP